MKILFLIIVLAVVYAYVLRKKETNTQKASMDAVRKEYERRNRFTKSWRSWIRRLRLRYIQRPRKVHLQKIPQQLGRSNMKNCGFIKIVNITLENASAIEKMVNKAISDLNKQKIKILDLQITEDNIVLVLPKNYWRFPKSKNPLKQKKPKNSRRN